MFLQSVLSTVLFFGVLGLGGLALQRAFGDKTSENPLAAFPMGLSFWLLVTVLLSRLASFANPAGYYLPWLQRFTWGALALLAGFFLYRSRLKIARTPFNVAMYVIPLLLGGCIGMAWHKRGMADLAYHLTNATAFASWNDHFSYPIFRTIPYYHHYGGEYLLGALRNIFPWLGPYDTADGLAVVVPVLVFLTAAQVGILLMRRTRAWKAAAFGILPLITAGIRIIPAVTHHYQNGFHGIVKTLMDELSAAAIMPYVQFGTAPSGALTPLFAFPLLLQLYRLCHGIDKSATKPWALTTLLLLSGLSIFDETYFLLFLFCFSVSAVLAPNVRVHRFWVGGTLFASFIAALILGGSALGGIVQVINRILPGHHAPAVAQLSTLTFSATPSFCAWPAPLPLTVFKTWKLLVLEFGFILPVFFVNIVTALRVRQQTPPNTFFSGLLIACSALCFIFPFFFHPVVDSFNGHRIYMIGAFLTVFHFVLTLDQTSSGWKPWWVPLLLVSGLTQTLASPLLLRRASPRIPAPPAAIQSTLMGLSKQECYVLCEPEDPWQYTIHVPRKALMPFDPTLLGSTERVNASVMEALCVQRQIPDDPALFQWQHERPGYAIYRDTVAVLTPALARSGSK